MIIIPAIDILGGRCVRLRKGDYGQSTTYAARPEDVARAHEDAGALWIHVVDLDAARGQGDNRRTIALVRKAAHARIEVGGGVRSEQDIEELLSIGIDRVVLAYSDLIWVIAPLDTGLLLSTSEPNTHRE